MRLRRYGLDVNDLRARKKVKVRRALVTAALRLFDARGFEATTIDDITDAAEVSRRTFFRYFRSKEDVFLLDPERKLELIRRDLDARRADEPTLAAVRRALGSVALDYASDVEVVRLQHRVAAREPALAAREYVYQVRWEDAIAKAVAADLGVDPAADTRSRVVAHVTVGALRSAVATWVAGGFEDDAVAVTMSTFDLIEPALAVLLDGQRPEGSPG